LVGPENDPILATWSAGIGRVGAFTSDYKDRWGVRWTEWDGSARLFAQLGRDLTRRVDDPRVRFEADIVMGEVTARASVLDNHGRHESLRRLRARIAGPDGFSRDVPLEATGAGSYSASVGLTRPGAYVVTLIDDETSHALATTGAALSAGEELRPTGTDLGLLRRLTEVSGGSLRDTLAGIFNDRSGRRFAYDPLTPWLLAFAAVSLLATVAFRRISFRTPVSRESAKSLRARLQSTHLDPATADSPAESPRLESLWNPTLAALQARRDRGASSRIPSVEPPESRSSPRLPFPSPQPFAPGSKPKEGTPPAAVSDSRNAGERHKTAAEILLERRRNRTRR
jgi:hypothetical protein